MDLSLNADQIAIRDALDALARPFENVVLHETGFALTDPALDSALAHGGFLDVGFDPELGTGTAALIVERIARLPQATEAAFSAIVRPVLGENVTGPICLVEDHDLHRPVRFLREGATVVVLGETVTSFVATPEHVRAEPEAIYAYPVGTLSAMPKDRRVHDVDPQQLRTLWRVALAAEASGLLAAALASVCQYVSERQQFGRPLATFQAMRHRLAEAQVRTNGVYWLAMKAAHTLVVSDAALAAFHAQESAREVVYDLHQFMGAMGMTLEHPLHLWTYRLKLLTGELGGRGGHALAAAEALWG
ncbi:acyl-CoA dehydrogenase family protein [Sphingomonas sp. 35-24ZXX]|uniref:acyl-CoA dehydrogenase family protein n=1 Tax=Sphingomonas sp. 35-24ZXX TaxID=1545915 RepID=UPI00053BE0A8|nr:acyl-CoA dehydrogenase family protein [Sphingomonas sp. 35-24ZXX]